MSDSRKIRGGNSEPTRWKLLWLRLDETTQDYWRDQFASARTQKSIREEIKAKHEVNLTRNSQLSRICKWVKEQDERTARAERMQENERRLREQHPDWTLDQLREEVLRMAYCETLAFGDFKLGLSTARIDLSEKSLELHREKFEFEAAKACMEKLPELKYISTNPQLSDTQKIDQIRLKLFGKIVP
jgi:hypothetical protein